MEKKQARPLSRGPAPVDGAVYQGVLDEIAALRQLRRSGKINSDAFKAQANRILAKLGPGWHVHEPARAPLAAHEAMRRELTERLGRLVVAPEGPPLPAGNVLSRELIAEAAFLVVSTQFGSPSLIARELKTTPEVLRQVMAFLQSARILGPGVGDRARIVLHPARSAEVLRRALLDWQPSALSPGPDPVPARPQTPADAVPERAEVPLSMLLGAVERVVTAQSGSSPILERALKIGPQLAGQLLGALEVYGVVGPPDGALPRAVLVPVANLQAAIERVRAAADVRDSVPPDGASGASPSGDRPQSGIGP